MNEEFQKHDGKPNVVIVRRKKSILARRKRLLTLVFLLLFTGIMLGTSTYAWFTSNKTVTVSDITVNVSTSSGLQISADAINFKTVLSTTDLKNATAATGTYTSGVTQIPASGASLSPVSTVGAVDTATGYMNMYLGELKTDLTCSKTKTGDSVEDTTGFCLTATKDTETNTDESGNFIAFDIFLKYNGSTATNLYLNLDSSGVKASGGDTGIKNASRIAFVVEGTKEDGTDASTIQALKGASSFANDAAGVNTVYIWEPNNNTHTSSGVNNYNNIYNAFNSGAYTAATFTSDGADGYTADRLPWYGVKAAIADSDEGSRIRASADTNYFTLMTTGAHFQTTTAATTSGSQLTLFTLPIGITKIRVYMWVDGQDADCEDAASGGNIIYSLQFSIQSNTTA